MTLLKIWEYHYQSNFAEGVKLLIEHDGRKFLTAQSFERLQRLALSGQAIDTYNLGKLTGALAKIKVEETVTLTTGIDYGEGQDFTVVGQYTGNDLPTLQTFFVKEGKKPPVAAPIGPEPSEDPAGEKLTSEKAIALHKEQSHHHALMVASTTDKERGVHAAEVLRIAKELDFEYDRLRALSNPETTEPASEPNHQTTRPASSALDVRRLHSLRTRISTITHKLLPKATGQRRADLEKELAKKQAEAQRLSNELA